MIRTATLPAGPALAAILALALAPHHSASADTWRGLTVADEDRCSPSDRADYPYPQSIEAQIVASQGGRIYGPYTGTTFRSTRETDIEHIVAASEAHDSGLCAARAQPRPRVRTAPATGDALALYDDNGNGRITCAEARRHGIAPVPRSHPAYPFMRDGDGDGVVCE